MKLNFSVGLLIAGYSVDCTMAVSLSELLARSPELSNITANLARFDFTQSLESQLANITFVAPSNNAWSQFMSPSASSPSWNSDEELQSLLTLHFLGGSYDFQAWTESSWVTTLLDTDISYGQAVEVRRGVGGTTIKGAPGSEARVVSQPMDHDSGLLYIIDGVLLPPRNFSTTAIDAELTSFQTKFEGAGMLQHIGDEGATIFAPDNDALRAVDSEISGMTAQDFTALFSYHTMDGRIVYSSDLYDGTTLPTLSFNGGVNQKLTISAVGNHFYVNAAKIIKSDILFKNGVMHIIDNVLNPDNQTAVLPDGVNQLAFGAAQGSDIAAAPASDSSSDPTSSGPSTAVLAGGIVGGILGGLFIAGIAFFLWLRRRQHAQQQPAVKQPSSDSEDSFDSGRRSDAGSSTTNDPPAETSWTKAELSGEDIERQQVFPKHELWTKSNVHEADTLGIGRDLAELSGEGVDPHQNSQTSSMGVLNPMGPISPSRSDDVMSPMSPSRSDGIMSPMSHMATGGFR